MIVGVVAEELLLPLAIPPFDTYVDPDVFPFATIRVPGFLLLEGSFDEGDTFYQAYVGDVSLSIYPPSIADPDTVYAFTTSRSAAIVSPPITDADVFYSPLVLSKVLGPQLFVDIDVFGGVKKVTLGKATINQTVPIDSVFDVDIIYGAVIGRAGITLIISQSALPTEIELVHISETTANVIPLLGSFLEETASYTAPSTLLPHQLVDADAFQVPDLRGPIAPALFTDVDTFYSPTRLSYIFPGIVIDSNVFFVPSAGWKLLPGIVLDQDIFIGPAFAQPGSFALYVDAGEFIPAPTVTAQAATLYPPSFAATDAYYAPVVNPAIVPSYMLPDDVAGAPAIGFGPLHPVVSVIDPEPFFAPVIGEGPRVPSFVVDTDLFYAPILSITQTLVPGVITDTDVFYAPNVSTAGFDGTLALDGPIMPATPQPTVIYIEG
jgi:hypothetical protein